MSDTATRARSLAGSFGLTRSFIDANLGGMDAAMAAIPSGEGGGSAHWVLGHIVYWRNEAVGMLGGTPIWSEADAQEFRGVQKGDAPSDLSRSFDQLRADLDTVSDRLVEALESSDADDQLLDTVAFLATHEAYHSGQLGIFRRLAGLKGVIGQ